MVYGHASGADVTELMDDIARFQDAGYQAIRAQAGVPGLAGSYGVRKGLIYEPAATALPVEQSWSTEEYLAFAPCYLRQVREKFGFDFHLLHDVHHRLTPNGAARFGKEVEELRLFWMEDPTPAENQESFRHIRRHTTTPIAVGEVLNSIWDVQQLITEQLIDYVRTSVSHSGGITHLRRIFDLAALYQVRSGSHGPTDLSPVSLSAATSVDISIPNFGIQEYMAFAPETLNVFQGGASFKNGALHVSEEPGLGVHYDDKVAERYPYDPKYLPVARRLDGSVHDW